MTHDLTKGSIAKHFFRMLASAYFGFIFIFIVDLLAVFYLSTANNNNELAAFYLSKSLIFFITSVVIGFCTASSSRISNKIGQKNIDGAKKLSSSSIISIFIIISVIVLIFIFNLSSIVFSLSENYEINIKSINYLYAALPGAIFMSMTQMNYQIMRSFGNSTAPMLMTFVCMALVALLDFLFIIQSNLGVIGAAHSYTIVGISSFAISTFFTLFYYKLLIFNKSTYAFKYFLSDLKSSAPSIIGSIAAPIGTFFIIHKISQISAFAMADFAVIDRISELLFCVFFTIPSVLTPIISQNLGAKIYSRVKLAFNISIGFVFIYSVFILLITNVFHDFIFEVFRLDQEKSILVSEFLRIGPIFWIFIGLYFIALSVFLSYSMRVLIFLSGWFRSLFLPIPLIIFGSLYFGEKGILFGQLSGAALIGFLTILLASFNFRKNTLKQHI